MNDGESYKSIAARVRLALQCLQQGNEKDAEDILKMLASVLPAPDRRHWNAANRQKETRSNDLAGSRGLDIQQERV